MKSFLNLAGKTFLVLGVANRKSVAWHAARRLEEQGATVLYSVRSEARREGVRKLLPDREIFVCDVQSDAQIQNLAAAIAGRRIALDGFLHSVAFANYEGFTGRFHEVSRKDFLQAVEVSCYSLVALSNALKPVLGNEASVVTISISTTRMAAEPYGYMAPAKAALDSTLCFLAKSFSRFSQVRFNAVCAGLLKTSASAGIPDYLDYYLYAEQATLRRQAVRTEEVADAAVFLLSERSAGINAQGLVVDAGMSTNYFDAGIVRAAVAKAWPAGGGSPDASG
ncbi:MAG: Enoyl-[acyl-carrier-protein] reductase [NADH] FabI [Phycisphaerae bacterium]|nr:Enoyl-[acyl-carrier-protein] reductase [NADH] FabI [Phycisphaerae bacterium]